MQYSQNFSPLILVFVEDILLTFFTLGCVLKNSTGKLGSRGSCLDIRSRYGGQLLQLGRRKRFERFSLLALMWFMSYLAGLWKMLMTLQHIVEMHPRLLTWAASVLSALLVIQVTLHSMYFANWSENMIHVSVKVKRFIRIIQFCAFGLINDCGFQSSPGKFSHSLVSYS